MSVKTTITIAAGSAAKALKNVRTWYDTLGIGFTAPPVCTRSGKGLYDVTVFLE